MEIMVNAIDDKTWAKLHALSILSMTRKDQTVFIQEEVITAIVNELNKEHIDIDMEAVEADLQNSMFLECHIVDYEIQSELPDNPLFITIGTTHELFDKIRKKAVRFFQDPTNGYYIEI